MSLSTLLTDFPLFLYEPIYFRDGSYINELKAIVKLYEHKEDLKECIDMGLDAEDIAYLVNQYRDNKDNTQFFTYCNTQQMYGLHILSKADVTKAISKQIEQIAYNTLKYPYKDAYAELYREFVVPMIEQQMQ